MKLARARFKDIANISPEHICCDELRAHVVRQTAGVEILVVLNRVVTQEMHCGFCKRQFDRVKYIETTDGRIALLAAIDIEEGISA